MAVEDPEDRDANPDALPDKPPVEGLPTDEELEAEEIPGEEDVPEEEMLSPEDASADDTIDNQEEDVP